MYAKRKTEAIFVYILLVLTIPLTGCLKNATSDSEQKLELELEEELVEELVGEWKSACSYHPSDQNFYSNKQSYNEGQYSGKSISHTDDNCLNPIFSSAFTGTYEVGNETIITSGETVREVNYHYSSWSITVQSGGTVERLNALAYCEKSDWEVGIAHDVTNCAAFAGPIDKFTIYKIDFDRLLVGDNEFGDGLTLETRPSQLDSTIVYIKQ